MRWGAKDWRASASRYLPACAALGVALVAEFSTNAIADILEARPILGIEQIFTDNVRADSADRDADGITVLNARVEAALTTTKVNAVADVNFYYNEFWAANDLDNFNGNGIVAGRGELWDNVFFVDGIAEKNDVYLASNDRSASGLTTGQGQIQQTSYAVSPFITTQVFGVADLLVRGNYAQVLFDRPSVGIANTLLTDVTVKQVGARLDTGDRSSLYRLVGTAEHIETDQGFEQENVVGGVFLNLTKAFTAIGHIGYERITDPTIAPLRGPIWSAGGRYRLDDDSFVQFEYGHRFGDATYSGQINFLLTPRVRVVGIYTDELTPIQLTLVRTVDDLLDQNGNFNISTPTAPSLPDPTVIDAIVRDRDMTLTTTYTNDLQIYTLTFAHSDRFFPSISDSEKFFVVDFTLEEQLSRKLGYLVHGQYQDNYSVLVGSSTSQTYRTELTFFYKYTETVTFGGGYAWRLETLPSDIDVYENVLRFSVQQAF